MKVEIHYGREGTVPLEIADANLAGVLEPNPLAGGDPGQLLRRALEQPVAGPAWERFVEEARDILVLVNDATRPTPTARVLDEILPLLERRPLRFLVATGIHRAPSQEELRQIFGHHLDRLRGSIHVHDARSEQDMVLLGRSRNGTEMRVNRLGVEADRIVIISSVEPHYFAGYTGGRKSFLPGIAAYSTIEQNHRLALRPEAQALRLAGNPVHEDMVDALSTVRQEIFAINTVLDGAHRLVGVAAGDINRSLEQAARLADRVFSVPVEAPADIVVAEVKFPADIDLYQSQKGIDNAKLALADGGILILVSACREGTGEEAFMKLLSSADTPEQVLEKISGAYRLGYHKAGKLAEIFCRARVWAVTELEPGVLESIFITPRPTVQQALDQALAEKGSGARVLVLRDASLTVPRLPAAGD